jgi:hypothetical protein
VAKAKAKAEADAKAASDANAAKEAELKQLREQLAFATSGQKPVGTSAAAKEQAAVDPATVDFSKESDPKARAKAEYAANLDGCKDSFLDEATYVGYRAAELKGQVKHSKPAR